MSVIHGDVRGLCVIAGGYKARPGGVTGYDHAYDMSDGGLKIGDRVKARHVSGAPLIRITLADGRKLHWHTDPTYDLAAQVRARQARSNP
jgi:hypothetical protein